MEHKPISELEKAQIRSYYVMYIPYTILHISARILAVWLTWNALLPKVTSFAPINLWQAALLLLLSYLLTGKKFFGIQFNQQVTYTSHEGWRLRWKNMSPKEKQAVIEGEELSDH